MFASHPRALLPVLIAVIAVIAGGCTTGDQMTKDQARKEVHQRVDKLAKRLGTNPVASSSEGAAGLDPDAPTLDYSYRVNVDVNPQEALEELRGSIADDMREHGWTIRDRPERNAVGFHHEDGRVALVSVFPDDNYANIIGETPFKNTDN